jgi:predicted PurR-regulated permease PerM
MDEPARPDPHTSGEGATLGSQGADAPADDTADGPSSAGTPALASAVAPPSAAAARARVTLPPVPFMIRPADGGPPRFAPLSPRFAVLLVAGLVVGLLLWMARDTVRPFVLGLLLVYLLDIPVRRLVRRGMRRSLAILLVYVVAIVAIVGFLAVTLTPLINEIFRFIEDFPRLADQLNSRIKDLADYYSHLEIPKGLRDWIDSILAGVSNGEPGAGLDLAFLLPLVTGAGSLLGALFGYIILPIWVFYLAKDQAKLVDAFDHALPVAWRFDTWVVLRSVERVFGQWVRAQVILGFAVGIFTFIGLLILSVVVDPIFGRYAILLSVIAGILELVPVIGPIISAIPAILIGATAGIESVIAALVLYTLVQQVENNFLVPKIQGDATDLHPAAVIFAIIIGGALAGLLGAILALPVAAAFRDVVRYLFRRLSDDDPEAVLTLVHRVGMDPLTGRPDLTTPAGIDPARG